MLHPNAYLTCSPFVESAVTNSLDAHRVGQIAREALPESVQEFGQTLANSFGPLRLVHARDPRPWACPSCGREHPAGRLLCPCRPLAHAYPML